MKKRKFKAAVFTALAIGLSLILVAPLIYEIEINRAGLLTTDSENGFYADYFFYTTYTVFRNTSNAQSPEIGLAGGINISYLGNNEYSLKGILINSINSTIIYETKMKVSADSIIAKWLIPSTRFENGHYVNLWNNTSGQVYGNGPIYGSNPYSREGIIIPNEIKVSNVPLQNKTVLPTPNLQYSFINNNQSINVATIWSGYLAPFSKVFPSVNYSTEMVFILNNTNVALNPLGILDFYVGPQIIFALIFTTAVSAFYFITIRVSASKRRAK